MLTTFFKALINSLPIFALAACIWGIVVLAWGIEGFFSARYDAQVQTVSTVTAISENQSLTTSIAAVDLLWLREKGRSPTWWSLPRLSRPELYEDDTIPTFDLYDEVPGKIDGHCLHSYFVYYGYDEIKVDPPLTVETLPEPTIQAIHPVRSTGAPSSQLDECHSFNGQAKREQLKTDIEDMLLADRVLGLHKKQGVQAYAQVLDASTHACEQSSGTEAAAPSTVPCFRDKLAEIYARIDGRYSDPPDRSRAVTKLREIDDKSRAALVVAYARDRNRFGTMPAASIAVTPGGNGAPELNALAAEGFGEITVASNPLTPDESQRLDAELARARAAPAATVVPGQAAPERRPAPFQSAAGAFSLADFLGAQQALRRFDNLDQDQRQGARDREILLYTQAHIGAVQVTISIIDLATVTRQRRILWDSEGSYIQRDVMRIVVGSPASAVYAPEGVSSWASAPVIRIQRPDIMAVDRYSTLNIRYGRENVWDDAPPGDDSANPGWTASVTRRIETAGWRTFEALYDDVMGAAESIIRQRIAAVNPSDAVYVEFVNDTRPPFDFESVARFFSRAESTP